MEKFELCKNICLILKNLVSFNVISDLIKDDTQINELYKSTVHDVFKNIIVKYLNEVKNEGVINKVQFNGIEYTFNLLVWANTIYKISAEIEEKKNIQSNLRISELCNNIVKTVTQAFNIDHTLTDASKFDFLHDMLFLKYVIKPSITQTIFRQLDYIKLYDVNRYLNLYKSGIIRCFSISINNIPSAIINVLDDINESIKDDIICYSDNYDYSYIMSKIRFEPYEEDKQCDVSNLVSSDLDIVKNLSLILSDMGVQKEIIESFFFKIIMTLNKDEINQLVENLGQSKKLMLLCYCLYDVPYYDKERIRTSIENCVKNNFLTFKYGFNYVIYNKQKISDITKLNINRRTTFAADPDKYVRNQIYECKHFKVYDRPNEFKSIYCKNYDITTSLKKYCKIYNIDIDYVNLIKNSMIELENIINNGNLYDKLCIISTNDFDNDLTDDMFFVTNFSSTLSCIQSDYRFTIISDLFSIILSYIVFNDLTTKYTFTDKSKTFSEFIVRYKQNNGVINKLALENIHELCKFLDFDNYISPNIINSYYMLFNDNQLKDGRDIINYMYENKQYIIDQLFRKIEFM